MKRNRAIFPGYVHRSIRSAPQAPRRTMCLAPDFGGAYSPSVLLASSLSSSPNRRQVLPGEYYPLGTKKRFVSGSRAHPFACLLGQEQGLVGGLNPTVAGFARFRPN
jgi:hypothetical protein